MSKIEELEERINNLEKIIDRQKQKNRNSGYQEFGKHFFTKSPEYYKEYLEEKFSRDKFNKDGLPKSFYQFDFSEMLSEANKCTNRVKKLNKWKYYDRQLTEVLGTEIRNSPYWFTLSAFVKGAVEYYKDSIFCYILENEKYVDFGGPREQKEKKEKGYKVYKELKDKQNSNYFHQDGRHKGGPKWAEIDPILRKELGLTEYNSLRAIRDYIRKQEK